MDSHLFVVDYMDIDDVMIEVWLMSLDNKLFGHFQGQIARSDAAYHLILRVFPSAISI